MEQRPAADLTDLGPLTALGSPVRRRLYELVSASSRAVGRDEAAASAGISRSLAAYHLDKLVDVGLLEASFLREGVPRGPGAGRPAKLYRRASREFVLSVPPRDYELLGEVLVRAADQDRCGVVRATLDRGAYDVGRSLGQGMRQNSGSERRELLDALRRRGYEPSEDEHGAIRLHNCPFESVATQCPEVVCGLNLSLLQGLIEGLDVQAQVAPEPEQGHCCVVVTV